METLKKAIQPISSLSEESWTLLQKVCSSRKYNRNEFVLQQGAVCNGMYFVESGLLRNFYLKDDKEVSEWFAFEGTFCFSIISYFERIPSYLAIQCLEDSEVITLSYQGLERLRKENIEISNLLYSMLSFSLILSQKRMVSLQFETALQRYEKLIKEYPNLVQWVPLVYISSYLGVSAETLSRIRSQVH